MGQGFGKAGVILVNPGQPGSWQEAVFNAEQEVEHSERFAEPALANCPCRVRTIK